MSLINNLNTTDNDTTYCVNSKKLIYTGIGALCILFGHILSYNNVGDVVGDITNSQPIFFGQKALIGKILYFVGWMIFAYRFNLDKDEKFVFDNKTLIIAIPVIAICCFYIFNEQIMGQNSLMVGNGIVALCLLMFGFAISFDRNLGTITLNQKKSIFTLTSTILVIISSLFFSTNEKNLSGFGLPMLTVGLLSYVVSDALI
jgi:hypothetical protein